MLSTSTLASVAAAYQEPLDNIEEKIQDNELTSLQEKQSTVQQKISVSAFERVGFVDNDNKFEENFNQAKESQVKNFTKGLCLTLYKC